MQLKTILNRVQKIKSFVYGAVRWVEGAASPTLEVELASSGQWPAGVFGLWAERPGVRQVAGPALRVRPVLGDEGVLGLCTATGGVYALRGTGGGDALGGGQTPGDPDLRLVSGELGEASFLEGGGRGLPKQLGRGVRCGRDGGRLWSGAPGFVGDPVSWHRRDRLGPGPSILDRGLSDRRPLQAAFVGGGEAYGKDAVDVLPLAGFGA